MIFHRLCLSSGMCCTSMVPEDPIRNLMERMKARPSHPVQDITILQ